MTNETGFYLFEMQSSRKWSLREFVAPLVFFLSLHSLFLAILSSCVSFSIALKPIRLSSSSNCFSLIRILIFLVSSILFMTRFICLPKDLVKSSSSFLLWPPKLSSPLQKPKPI